MPLVNVIVNDVMTNTTHIRTYYVALSRLIDITVVNHMEHFHYGKCFSLVPEFIELRTSQSKPRDAEYIHKMEPPVAQDKVRLASVLGMHKQSAGKYRQ